MPLVDEGKWAADAFADVSYTIFLSRDNRTGSVPALNTVDATRRFWVWLNAKGGYNFSSYLFRLDADTRDIDKQISRKNYHNLFGQANIGFYFTPFQNGLPWLNVTGSAGFEYKQNDNNYAALNTVRIKTYEKVVQDDGTREAEVTSEETSAREGDFIVSNSANVNYNLTLLFAAQKYAFGLNFFGKTRLSGRLKSTDLGFGVSFPVKRTKNDKPRTIANFNFNYQVIDVGGRLNPAHSRFSDKGLLGLTVAIPVYTH